MNSPKFTPGPWRITKSPRAFVANSHGGLITYLDCAPDSANASLIAAAPELYEELAAADVQLRMCAEAIEAGRYDEALLHASAMPGKRRAALAKARGKS